MKPFPRLAVLTLLIGLPLAAGAKDDHRRHDRDDDHHERRFRSHDRDEHHHGHRFRHWDERRFDHHRYPHGYDPRFDPRFRAPPRAHWPAHPYGYYEPRVVERPVYLPPPPPPVPHFRRFF